MTEEHFRSLIELFWARKTLQNVDEVRSLARCAGETYALESQKTWLWELTGVGIPDFEPPPIRDERYPVPSVFIPRKKLLEQVLDKITFCLNHRLPLVIYGEPGIGKTTFMESLVNEWGNSFKLQHHFPDGIMTAYLKGKSSEVTLPYWLRELVGNFNFASLGSVERQSLLQKKLRDKHLLLLIDDVDEPKYAHLLMQADPKKSLTIITTANPDVAMQLSINKNATIKLGGFSQEQVEDYYRKVTEKELIFPDKLKALGEIFDGNPLALFFAFKLLHEQKDDWNLVLKLLNQELSNYPDNIRNGVFLVQKVIYEKVLSPELQQRFRALGSLFKFRQYDLEAFTALWDCSPDIARMILNELENKGGLVIQTGDDTWDIHGKVLDSAKSFLGKNAEELRFANGWVKRGLDSLEKSLMADRKQELIPWKDVFKLRSVRKSNYPVVYFDAQKQNNDYFDYIDNNFWQIIERNPNVFIYKEFMYALLLKKEAILLDRKERRNRRILMPLVAISISSSILSTLSHEHIYFVILLWDTLIIVFYILAVSIQKFMDTRYSLRLKQIVNESFLRYQGYNETEIKYPES